MLKLAQSKGLIESLGLGLSRKVVDHIGDHGEAVYSAQFDINAFPTKAIAY